MVLFFGVALYTSTIFMIMKFIDYPLAQYMKFYCYKEITYIFKSITDFAKSTSWIICSLIIYMVVVTERKLCRNIIKSIFKRDYFFIRKNSISETAILLFFSVVLSGVIVNILKPIFGRVRPYQYFTSGDSGFQFLQFGSSFASFPSGHSATALSVATVFAISFPKWRVIIFSTGLIFAFSRIVTGNHYFSDVIVGGTIGFLTVLYLKKRQNKHEIL